MNFRLVYPQLGLALLAVTALGSGCASVFQLKSDPAQAEVFIVDPKTSDRKSIGKTPIEMPSSMMREMVGETALAGEYFTVVVEKSGFQAERLMVPASHFGTLVTMLDVKLKAGTTPKEPRVAKDILDRLFLAQKLARNKEFERAQVELDKILAELPDFARALSMRGSIYFVQKNYAESLKWYEQALNSDPQMEDAVQMVAKIRALQNGGRLPAASAPAAKPGGKP